MLYNLRYIIWLLVAVGLVVLLIFLILPSGKPKIVPQPLVSYATTGSTARLTIDGPETAESTHQSIQISVNADQVSYQQFNGYTGQVASTATFTNNLSAYQVFLLSLAHAGYKLGNPDPKLSDERGLCPLGDRYIFELVDNNGNDIERFWATSCGGLQTYGGNTSLTLDLFRNQVPNYYSLISGIKI